MPKPVFRKICSQKAFQDELLPDNFPLEENSGEGYYPYPRINDADNDVYDANWGCSEGTRQKSQEQADKMNPNLHRAGKR